MRHFIFIARAQKSDFSGTVSAKKLFKTAEKRKICKKVEFGLAFGAVLR